jgi:transposase
MVKSQGSAKVQSSGRKSDYQYVVSLDVHDKNTYIYAMDLKSGEIICDHNVPGSVSVALKVIDRLGMKKDEAVILYESGGCGFSPARMFDKAGYACKIIAANSIPRKGSGKRKNDRTDAINNFQYFMAETLRFVQIPSEAEVADREIERYRRDVTQKIGKQKQIIYAFAKRYGLVFDATKTSWTKAHRHWLKTVALHPSTRFVLDCYLRGLENLEAELGEIESALENLFNTNTRYKALKELYSLLPGFGQVNATTMVLEGGDLERFPHPNALMSFTGLIPGKRSSGGSDPSMSITKEGNRFLRLALVNAASVYRDYRLVYSKKSISGMHCTIQKEFLERVQKRLCMRYRYLRDKGKAGNKTRCAIARELAGFVWELSNKIAPKLEEYQLAA